MITILTEKNDVAKVFASMLGAKAEKGVGTPYYKGIWQGETVAICFARGHLISLADTSAYGEQYAKWDSQHFPCFPQNMKYKLIEGCAPYIETIKDLFNQSSLILGATDNDREGDLIFRYIYEYIGCSKPYKRVVYNDLTPKALTSALSNLVDSKERYAIEQCGKIRSWLDWLLGINMTVLFSTVIGKNTFNIGRVKLPTLSMIIEREKDILSFKKSFKYSITASIPDSDYVFISKIEDEKKDVIDKIYNEIKNKPLFLKNINSKREKKNAPLFFNTNSISSLCADLYNLSPKTTLDILEELYMKQYISYPRTTSEVVSENMTEDISLSIRKLMESTEYSQYSLPSTDWTPFTKRHFDDSGVDSHTAIVTTSKIPVPNELSANEQKVYDLVARSVLQIVYPCAIYEKTIYEATVDNYDFECKKTVVLQNGWQILSVKSEEDDITKPSPKPLSIGNSYDVKFNIKETELQPPKRYTYATLLKAMELSGQKIEDENIARLMKMKNRSLGTPATRGDVIESLIDCEYITTKGKSLYPTEKGIYLIREFPIAELKNPLYTGKLEELLHTIETKNNSPEKVKEFFAQQLLNWFNTIKGSAGDKPYIPTPKIAYNCPLCNGKVKLSKYGVFCENAPSKKCAFTIPSSFCGKTLSLDIIEQLVTKPYTNVVKGLCSYQKENGKVVLDEKGKPKVKLTFDSRLAYDKSSNRITLYTLDVPCPICNSTLTQKTALWECPNCDFKLWKKFLNKTLTESQMRSLCAGHKTTQINGLIGKSNKEFSAKLYLKDGKVCLCFE